MGEAERRGCVVLDCSDKSGGKRKKKKEKSQPVVLKREAGATEGNRGEKRGERGDGVQRAEARV